MCIWCVSRCPNACNEDTSVCVSGVVLVVLILVMVIPGYVYLVCFQLSKHLETIINICICLTCW